MKTVGILLLLTLAACAQMPAPENLAGAKWQDGKDEVFHGTDYPMAISGDANWILTAHDIGNANCESVVESWEVESGRKKVAFKGHKAGVSVLAFSPDGRWVLSGGGLSEVLPGVPEDTAVRLWDRGTGRELRRFEGHETQVEKLQFSPDCKRILTGASDSTARLWDIGTGALIRSFPRYWLTTRGTNPSFSPDGSDILMITRPGAEIYDSETGTLICKLEAETSKRGFNSAEYSPDGRFVISSSFDYTARLWDARTGREIRAFRGHTNFVLHASFSQDGTRVVTAGHDETLRIWDVATGKELKSLKAPGSVEQAYFAAEGKRIVLEWRSDANYTVVNGVSLWDLESGREVRRASGSYPFAYSRDRQKILVTDTARGGELWDAVSGEILRAFPCEQPKK
jgi:WD40 repeat protein